LVKGFKDKDGNFRPTGSPRKRATRFFTQNPNFERSNPNSSKANELKQNKSNNKIMIHQPAKKGKQNSIFYDGAIAKLKANDGTEFFLEAVGETRFTVDNKDFTNQNIDDAESELGLDDKKLEELQDKGKLELTNNNWFEISSIPSEFESEPFEDYDTAILNLKEIVKEHNRKVIV